MKKLIQSPMSWVILAVIVGAFVLVTRDKPSDEYPTSPDRHGFKDVLKNPDLLKEAGEAMDEVDEFAQEAKSWDDMQIRRFGHYYIFTVKDSDDAWAEARIHRALGSRTHATVLQILADKSLFAKLVKPTNHIIPDETVPETPFNRAAEMLGDAPPVEAIALLAPFLDSPLEEVRKDAALAISKTGSFQMIPHIKKAFKDDDEYVRSYALMGLEWSIKRLDKGVTEALYEDIKQLLVSGRSTDTAQLMYAFAPEKAKEFFLSEEVLNVDSSVLPYILGALLENEISVPRDKLISIIKELDKRELKYPLNNIYSASLIMLGLHQNAEDLAFLKKRISHQHADVAEGAVEGLLQWHGFGDYELRMWKAEEKLGYEGLPKKQQYYLSVYMLDAEICNGGISQYFLNSSGDQWRDAIAGLEAMNAKEYLSILNQVTHHFGKNGPSIERDQRNDQLAKLMRKNDELFDSLDDKYYDAAIEIELILKQYVLNNPDDFK